LKSPPDAGSVYRVTSGALTAATVGKSSIQRARVSTQSLFPPLIELKRAN
jgi:hypothetical protein